MIEVKRPACGDILLSVLTVKVRQEYIKQKMGQCKHGNSEHIKIEIGRGCDVKKLLWWIFNRCGLIKVSENQVKRNYTQWILQNLQEQKRKSNTQWLLIKGSDNECYWKGHLDTLDWMINWMESCYKSQKL